MGRKSLADKRINQILDAFEQSIIQHGLEQATLQRTAQQAGVNIGIIHHYIGKRDDLLRLMVRRFAKKATDQMAFLVKATPVSIRLPYLLKEFFQDANESESGRILNELFVASVHNRLIQQLLLDINQVYRGILADEIGRKHPHLSAKQCQNIAYSILSLAYGSGLLMEIGFEKQQNDEALQAAKMLIQNAASAELG